MQGPEEASALIKAREKVPWNRRVHGERGKKGWETPVLGRMNLRSVAAP